MGNQDDKWDPVPYETDLDLKRKETTKKLIKLKKQRLAYTKKISQEIEKAKNSCSHKWRHYDYHDDNYDRDHHIGYKCEICERDIRQYDWDKGVR